MTNPTTTIAWPLAQQVATLIGAHANCSTIDVHPFWPGDKAQKPEFIVIEDLKVTSTAIAGWQSGRKQRNQTVAMTAVVYVSNKRTADALWDRLLELVGAVEDVFAADMTLGGYAGVTEGQVGDIAFDPFETSDVGFVGTARVALTVLTRLH